MYYTAKIFVIRIIVIVIIAVVIAVLRYFIPVPADAEVFAVFAVYRNYFGFKRYLLRGSIKRISSVGVPVKIMLLVTVSVLILLLVPISGASAVLSSSALA